MDSSLIATPVDGSDAAVPEATAAAVVATPVDPPQPRVLLRLGFNKVLYDTDIHPDGYVAPRGGHVVRNEPKVSAARQCGFTCVLLMLMMMMASRWMDLEIATDGSDRPMSAMGGRHAWEEAAGMREDKYVPRDCSAAYHTTEGGGITIGGQEIPSNDEEVSSAIGMNTWPGGIDPNGDEEEEGAQLSWANCPRRRTAARGRRPAARRCARRASACRATSTAAR